MKTVVVVTGRCVVAVGVGRRATGVTGGGDDRWTEFGGGAEDDGARVAGAGETGDCVGVVASGGAGN